MKIKSIIRSIICLTGCVLALASCDAMGDDTPTTTAGHTHSYGEWTIVQNATCTAEGLKERICSCGEKETKTIDKVDHFIVSDDPVKATCEKDGKTIRKYCRACDYVAEESQIIPATGHNWKDATCESPKKCSNCGMTEGVALEHTVVIDNAVAATCTTSGKSEGKHCSACGKAIVAQTTTEPLGHNYKETVVTKVSCEKDGKYTYKCSRCGDSYSKNVSATGHNWKDATCTSAKKCTNCGETSGSALGHKYSNRKCTRCGQEAPDRLTKIFYISGMYNNYMHLGVEFLKNDCSDVTKYVFHVDLYQPNGTYYAAATYTVTNDNEERIDKLFCLGRGNYHKYTAKISQIDFILKNGSVEHMYTDYSDKLSNGTKFTNVDSNDIVWFD